MLYQPPTQLFTSTGVDMSVKQKSAVMIMQQNSGISIGFSWDGSGLNGVIEVQVSNDYSTNPDGSVQNSGTWNTLPFSVNGSVVTSLPVATDSGNGFVDVQTRAYAVRTVYTPSAGTGTLFATLAGKFI
jgi:hypothetical protein